MNIISPVFSAVVASLLVLSPQHGAKPPVNPALPKMPEAITMANEPDGPLATVLLSQFTPGNVALTPAGRMFISLHPFGQPEIRVAEVLRNGSLRAYPTEDWARKVNAQGIGIQSIIGIKSDANGTLWMLDAGNLGEPNGTPPKLIAWDTTNERLLRVVHIPPPVSSAASFLQDLAIDTKRDVIYIADCGISAGFEETKPAIVVVYLKTGVARRLLENAACVRAEPDAAMVIDGTEVTVEGKDGKRFPPRIGINPITIDDANEWVYFGSMHGTTVWKVKADDLSNPGLPAGELEQRVLRHGTKSVSDGFTIDSAGNIYVTDVTRHAIGVVAPDGSYKEFVRDDAILQWPDGISAGADGNLYAVVNQLNLHPALRGGPDGSENAAKPPFRVVRFTPIAPATLGR